MFGPESGKGSWNELPFVYDKVRVRKGRRSRAADIFLDIFAKEVNYSFINIWKSVVSSSNAAYKYGQECSLVFATSSCHNLYMISLEFPSER